MKRIIAGTIMTLTFVAFSASVQAEVKNFKIKGMHCKGCVESVDGEICDPSFKFKSCKVDLAKDEKNVGLLKIETAPGQKVVIADLKKKLENAGEKYELIEVK